MMTLSVGARLEIETVQVQMKSAANQGQIHPAWCRANHSTHDLEETTYSSRIRQTTYSRFRRPVRALLVHLLCLTVAVQNKQMARSLVGDQKGEPEHQMGPTAQLLP
mmetsp:Transcript_94234/g.262250  ORF Transcript_94234/g.262250 Transcript_94234/m.262250 type:complete len:107 (+) Transcript_94234:233-553(+)